MVKIEDIAKAIQLRQVRDKMLRIQQVKNDNGMRFYAPQPKQDLFHRAGGFKRRYARTGNRFGKSTMGAAEDAAWAYGERPWYAKDDPARQVGIPQRSTKGLILVQDWDKANEIFTCQEEGASKGKLFQFLPKDCIQDVILNQRNVVCIRVRSIWGGISSIYLDTVKSYKNNAMGQESSDWDWIHVDEPIPEEMWIANSRGLIDRDGSAWFTCTPITEMWINDMFFPGRSARYDLDVPVADAANRKWVMTGSMHDNATLTDAAKKAFIADLPLDQIESRVNGRPRMLSGQVYKEFDNDHIYYEVPPQWEDMDKPPSDYTIRVGIDTHPRTPHAVLFSATSPLGYVFFWSEIFEACLMSGLIERIRAHLDGRTALIMHLEKAAYIPHPTTGTSMADELILAGLPVMEASKDLTRGIQAVKQFLKKRDALGKPICYFSNKLLETLREFDRYVWDPNKTDSPIDKHDHMMENLYRMVLGGLDYVHPADWVAPKMKLIEVNRGLMTMPKVPETSFGRMPPETKFNKARRYAI